ncbi:response regulator [Formosa algae]|uniref:DNA-binding NarL/FixJ family response regulator n=1 Tax=Formosa algae TaxID=225843 RepID=A0A9X0YKY8_9FLAO|nr:response regulator [Formosa algae]MBP1839159.1 DNA-binding NarL/FixJ family response regulator [Formosa algae]MDQ0333936.1 DNA-binding NarL/FixJ family response regulator [Formosa algae]OEI79674.1 transcriptional regulator [Formosa algae]PNW27566.1 response regulator [Formosa algae]
MQELIRILMTDDHPMIIEGYQNTLLSTKKPDQELQIDTANNCDESIEAMLSSIRREEQYDVLFIDIKMPPSADGLFTSGEDLARHARKILPNSKIVILTMFNETYRIHNIVEDINPEGFLIKSDLTSSELASAFQAILNHPPFYSGTVSKYLKQTLTSDIYLDDKNRRILYLLSQGIKTKNLAEHIDLSLSGVEKRKKQLKVIFNIEDGQDESLIKEAKKLGFI